ncbi:uncharacterized protein LOC121378456 [Gigantopelta aegis]|uniref:uncharacterized protein LOC121378456 n=1 Tax=Gigantopelta aegis TaxID=1735272 RepID=UPI001B887F8F|nr:uncharacterized protein LOC121378456 [Gigantopelta aegis]XP_041362562.1 uncharacterized protein LOC121378456 [Gigantopelta aegis]
MSKLLKKKLRDPQTKTAMGPCLVTFAIPLFIPGFTLTLVAFQDETGFSKYSALHITGMFFLASATLLLVVGIAMKCACHYKVSPFEKNPSPRLVSTHHAKPPSQDRRMSADSILLTTHVKDSKHHDGAFERVQIPGASVGSNENLTIIDERTNSDNVTIANETVSIPDETDFRPTYSSSKFEMAHSESLSGELPSRSNKDTRAYAGTSKQKKSVDRDSEHIINIKSQNVEKTGLGKRGDSKDNGKDSRQDTHEMSSRERNTSTDDGGRTRFKTKAVIRETFANLRSEGDGAEYNSVDSDGAHLAVRRGEGLDPGTSRPDEAVQQRTGIAWDDPSEEKKEKIRADDSIYSVNFFPPVPLTGAHSISLVTRIVAASDDNSDYETDSYDDMEFYDDEEEDNDDVTLNVRSQGGSTLPEVEGEGYGVDRFNNIWRGTSGQNSVEISSVLSQVGVESDSVSELYDETDETGKVCSDTSQGRISGDSSVVLTSEQSSLPDNGLQRTQRYQWSNDRDSGKVNEQWYKEEPAVTKFNS